MPMKARVLLTSFTALLMATSEAHASDTLPKANPPDLIGKWCGAYGEGWKKGDGPLEWRRCTKSALKELLDAEGYAYTLAVGVAGFEPATKLAGLAAHRAESDASARARRPHSSPLVFQSGLPKPLQKAGTICGVRVYRVVCDMGAG